MSWLRRGLLLLAFVFAVLGVHPCDTVRDDPAADHAAHHSVVHEAAAAPMVPATPGPDGTPDAGDCMGGACDLATVAERDAPPAGTDTLVAPNPSPPGPLAAGVARGHLHSGQSPGPGAAPGPDLTQLSVSRT